MKGIVLAGGTGSRLNPLTNVTNKHLLSVYNKPMIYYPLFSLKRAGITDILIVSGKGHAGHFLELLGSGRELGLNLSYEVQDEAGGIAQALALAETFAGDERVCVVLGDNIIQDDVSDAFESFMMQPRGAKIFLKKVERPENYGVPIVEGSKIKEIIEKPKNPPSDFAVTGIYMYDNQVFDIIRTLKPSKRGELEITDVNNFYIEQDTLTYDVMQGFWGDCGESFDSLLDAATMIQMSELRFVDDELNLDERKHQAVMGVEPVDVEREMIRKQKTSRKYLMDNNLL
jgi:glucose-1-phosphate thymidylyltransferase